MTQEQFHSLKKGDIVCNLASGRSYVIMDHTPPFPAISLVFISNPGEWDLFIIPTATPANQGAKASPKSVLWVLNQLKGAPGQTNRELVRRFLYVRGWIGPANLPEEWNLDHVPMSKKQVAALAAEIQQFEIDSRKPANSS